MPPHPISTHSRYGPSVSPIRGAFGTAGDRDGLRARVPRSKTVVGTSLIAELVGAAGMPGEAARIMRVGKYRPWANALARLDCAHTSTRFRDATHRRRPESSGYMRMLG